MAVANNHKEAVDIMRRLKFHALRQRHPDFPADETASIVKATKYTDKTANGLCKMTIECVTNMGGHATRVNVQGQARKHNFSKFDVVSGGLQEHTRIRYTRGTTRKGTPDIDIVLTGLSIKIEVKIGKDKQSPEQIKVQQEIERAGGKYFIAKDFLSTYNFLYNLLPADKQAWVDNLPLIQ